MRQSTRGVQYTPKATYTDFSKGMEYTAHAKDNNNPRAQLIKNMEIDADGKLSVRRPLVPLRRISAKQNSTQTGFEGVHPEDVLPEGHIKLKTIYAPFRELGYKFITIVNNTNGRANGNKSNVYFRYYDTLTAKWADPVYDVTLDDLIWDEATFPNRVIEYVFQPGTEILTLNTKNKTTNVSYTLLSGFKFTKQEAFAVTRNDIIDQGINLYGDTPLFISNNIENSNDNQIGISAILPYKANDVSAFGAGDSGYAFTPENFVYDVQPQSSDKIILKGWLSIPTSWLEFEIDKFFTLDTTDPSTPKWAWKPGMEAALKNGLGVGAQDTLKNLSPEWLWRYGSATNPTSDRAKPAAVGAVLRMPVFFTLLYDTIQMPRFIQMLKNKFNVSVGSAIDQKLQDNVTTLIEDLLRGHEIEWRGDLVKVNNVAEDKRIWQLDIVFPLADFVSSLSETPFQQAKAAIGTSPIIFGVKDIKISGQNDSNKNDFKDTARYPFDAMVTALSTESSKAMAIIPVFNNSKDTVNTVGVELDLGSPTTDGLSSWGVVVNLTDEFELSNGIWDYYRNNYQTRSGQTNIFNAVFAGNMQSYGDRAFSFSGSNNFLETFFDTLKFNYGGRYGGTGSVGHAARDANK